MDAGIDRGQRLSARLSAGSMYRRYLPATMTSTRRSVLRHWLLRAPFAVGSPGAPFVTGCSSDTLRLRRQTRRGDPLLPQQFGCLRLIAREREQYADRRQHQDNDEPP